MRLTEEQADKLIDYLQGSCNSIEAALQTVFDGEIEWEDLEEDDHAYIDDRIFCCETCNWWHENADSGDSEGNCRDCSDEEE